LAGGDDAVLSHRSAAAVWKMHPGDPTAPVDVLTTRKKRLRWGISIHHTLHLDPIDVRVREGLPITSPARTLVEIAGQLTDRELERALDEALVQRLVTLKEIEDALDRLKGRRHAGRLRALANRRREATLTRSQLEEQFLELIRRAGLPPPKVNHRIAGYEVDFFWPKERVVFEVDGYRFHSTRSAFERDRRKDAALKAAGIDPNRITWWQLTQEPLAVVVQVVQRPVRASGP
jgi:very-short-patch-repair endonuclease